MSTKYNFICTAVFSIKEGLRRGTKVWIPTRFEKPVPIFQVPDMVLEGKIKPEIEENEAPTKLTVFATREGKAEHLIKAGRVTHHIYEGFYSIKDLNSKLHTVSSRNSFETNVKNAIKKAHIL